MLDYYTEYHHWVWIDSTRQCSGSNRSKEEGRWSWHITSRQWTTLLYWCDYCGCYGKVDGNFDHGWIQRGNRGSGPPWKITICHKLPLKSWLIRNPPPPLWEAIWPLRSNCSSKEVCTAPWPNFLDPRMCDIVFCIITWDSTRENWTLVSSTAVRYKAVALLLLVYCVACQTRIDHISVRVFDDFVVYVVGGVTLLV